MKNDLKKNFIWNFIGSTFNSFTSLFFLIIVTRINGISDAGIFTFAFSNACFLQVIGLYAGRTYQVTENNNKITDNDYFYNRIISNIFMIIICLIFCILKQYNFYKFLIIMLLLLFKAIDSFSDVIYGIIQKNDKLYQVGISLFLKGLLGTLLFIVINIFTKNLILSILGLISINILLVFIYDFICLKKCGFKLNKINVGNVISIFKFGFFTFLFIFLTQYLINSPKYAIDNYLSNDLQTVYGIISMPATLMILISNFLIHPFLLKITSYVKEKKYKKIYNLVLKISSLVCIICVVGEIFCYIFGIPIFNFIYNVNLDNYLIELLIIILGASIFAITYIISAVLIAMRKTFNQTVIFAITSIISFIISKYLTQKYMLLGASLSYLISMFILLILYIITFVYCIRKEEKNG